jgi:hypothetical protein
MFILPVNTVPMIKETAAEIARIGNHGAASSDTM